MKVIGVILIIVGLFSLLVVCETLINYLKNRKDLTEEVKKDIKQNAIISVVCLSIAVACFVAGTFTKIVLLIALFIFCCVGFSNSVEYEKQKKLQKQLEEEREKRQKEQEEKRIENTKREIDNFVRNSKNGKNERTVYSLYSQMDSLYNRAQREYLIGKLCVPTTPTYTRGVVQGSLADNVSILANAQKQADYEKRLQNTHNSMNSAYENTRSFNEVYYEIESILQSIPNSEKYVEMHRELYRDKLEQLEKLRRL